MNLTEKRKKFAEYDAQCGNITESAIKAGYSKTYAETRAFKLLENIEICRYIQELTEKSKTNRILTAIQRQEILSDIARNEENYPSDRIKSIDTLNKMTGEYLQKVSVTTENKLPELLEALKSDTD